MPASRKSARRHRGSHRMVPRATRTYEIDEEARIAELEAEVPDASARAALDHWHQHIDKPLFVYFIQEDPAGPVKVGQALNPVKRLRGLQCGNPRTLYIQALVLATVDTESHIHTRWGPACHIRGEWFGNGLEDALLAVARGASKEQIEAHRNGKPADMVANMAISLISYPQWHHGLNPMAGIS